MMNLPDKPAQHPLTRSLRRHGPRVNLILHPTHTTNRAHNANELAHEQLRVQQQRQSGLQDQQQLAEAVDGHAVCEFTAARGTVDMDERAVAWRGDAGVGKVGGGARRVSEGGWGGGGAGTRASEYCSGSASMFATALEQATSFQTLYLASQSSPNA